jgi:hypothetical protein
VKQPWLLGGINWNGCGQKSKPKQFEVLPFSFLKKA